jgi:F-type H+-transporting ATPase subunit b
MKNNTLLFISLVLLTKTVEASSGGASEGHHGVPTVVYYQALNVSVIVVALYYFLKNPVREFFGQKKADFVKAAEKAADAVKKAQAEHEDIRIRLQKLESTSDESIARARAEAAELQNSLIQEAQNISKKIKEEAASAAKIEVEKAKRSLREQLINDSILAAKKNLETKLGSAEQDKLMQGFTREIQEVKS